MLNAFVFLIHFLALAESAVTYSEKLNSAQEREKELEDVLKTFQENKNSVSEWLTATEALVVKKDYDTQGCGVRSIDELMDEFDDGTLKLKKNENVVIVSQY